MACAGYLSREDLAGTIVLVASRASGRHLGTQTLNNQPLGHPKDFVRNF